MLKNKILIIAGGTGGHIFPALVVAEALKKEGCSVSWLGAYHGLESQLVPAEYGLQQITIRSLRGAGWKQKCSLPWRLIWAVFQSYRIIQRLKPDVVLAMGGYVAGPGGIAAWLARKKLVLHEQNAKAGLTNRGLAYFASVRLQAFHAAFARHPAITIGNPVRPEIQAIAVPSIRYASVHTRPLRILIAGGSQGARAINQAVLSAWRVYPDLASLEIWHQSGEKDYHETRRAYDGLSMSVRVDAFITDMAAAYDFADLIICRAGAMTVSEIAAVGIASILIPYPLAADNHQYWNARYLSDQHGAILLEESALASGRLGDIILEYAQHRENLLRMAQSAKKQTACIHDFLMHCIAA